MQSTIVEGMSPEKQMIMDMLSKADTRVLSLAYVYAQNFNDYGVDVTQRWDTAVTQSANLQEAYHKGYCEGARSVQGSITPSIDTSGEDIVIKIPAGTLKYEGRDYTIYQNDWFREHCYQEAAIASGTVRMNGRITDV